MSETRLDADLVSWARSILPSTELFGGEPCVPCHRDYSPRNWLVCEKSTGLQWSLIDFERARLDLGYADFQRPSIWPMGSGDD